MAGNLTSDIPVAQRDRPQESESSRGLLWLLVVGITGFGAIAIIIAFFFLNRATQPIATAGGSGSSSAVAAPQGVEGESNIASEDNVLGHLPYQEAPIDELVAITADRRILLRQSAAQKFIMMAEAARADGVILASLSGYRTVAEQDSLFFEVKAQRQQNAAKRAEVSAPPGYSEHHTGYAIDIGDGRTPATHLSVNFENTAAFRWLQENAARYSFELSFPRDNAQGISYEPWHWRFVGDIDSLETFYRAQNTQK
ncbi:M15 family metallopeptidase [Spirulina sp. 06S082]|uniref:M15 family metallopeptidase n=1 Tax=Spirulina sp. 06S082 TaxID=3110248 RepID=UPI002B1F6694|nr:M15 family metallopeptidase [Spirulina sp. 06S082]MEA5471070.1 M15 family metallopeptidase [Spirulina sp. 06S082]